MGKIFVSYRRDDSKDVTGRIVEHLNKRFGKSEVFNDVFDIQGGQKFRTVISNELNHAKVLLVVIGNEWVDAIDGTGRRRLEDSDDFVRLEVATGLAQAECEVIPVLVDNQQVPKRSDLPDAIQDLAERNVVHVRPDPDFADDMERLCRIVAEHVPPKKKWPLPVAVVTCIFTAIITALFLGPGRGERPDTIIQAFDSLTRERILRPFTLTFADGRTGTSSDNEHRIKDTMPSDVQIKELEIHGFRKEGQDIQEFTAGNDHLLKVYLDRSETFQDQIRPNPRNLERPSDTTLKSYVEGENVAPEDVTLLVDNLTSQHIDVLMLWQPAMDVKEEWHKANRVQSR